MTKNKDYMVKQKFPEPTAGALIINREGKIFLIKSHKWRNKYVIPGGHIELGEKIEEALKREIKEETGLEIHDIEPVNIQEFIFGKAFWKRRHFIFHNFTAKTKNSQVSLNDEAQEYVWMDLKEALKLPVESYIRKTIKEYIKKYLK